MVKESNVAAARFRKGLDDDIKRKYNALPEEGEERSNAVRDALRLWFGIEKKLVFKQTSVPVKPPRILPKPLIIKEGVKRHD